MDNNFRSYLRLKLLSSIEGIGPRNINLILSEFKDLDNLINASSGCIMSIPHISPNAAKKIINFDYNNKTLINKYTQLYKDSINKGIKIITYYCNEYPERLKNIYAPPSILYAIGNASLNETNSIAVVGTRNLSAYGRLQTENFTKLLSENGLTIISGMAKGIDTIAHKTALKYSAKTIAVTGSGLDIIYPAENKDLFNAIQKNGLIISEFDLGTKPDAGNFPRRNRIISALALGTLVIETRIKGGAMQTANLALEQGKEVFAVPGNIGSANSEGTNLLIQNGTAKLVTNANDILVELNLQNDKEKISSYPPDISLSFFEEQIYNFLKYEPTHIDTISNLSNMTVQECLTHLLMMEMQGIVEQLPGKNFRRL